MTPKVSIYNDFDEKALRIGDIIFYVNEELDEPTDYPHPHVIVAVENGYFYTICGTSQKETVERIIKNTDLDYVHFPAVGPCEISGLPKETYFDCSLYFEIHGNDLQDKFQHGEDVNKCGNVTHAQYEQMRIAMKLTRRIDILSLLVHPED